MAEYKIENSNCLGYSCGGSGVYVDSEGFVELTDDEVAKIVDLIREAGSTDIEEIGLKEKYPDIYDTLDDAYRHMAYDAEELHWLWEGYESGYFEYDKEELIAYCEENCGFKFDYNEEDYIVDGEFDEDSLEDDKENAFDNWVDDYLQTLTDQEVKSFFYDHMNADLNLDHVDYEVAIPEEIIDMAEND